MAFKKKTDTISLHDLFLMKIQALYDIENELIKALPKLAKNSFDEDLASAFTEHLEETRLHAERLEDIFEKLDRTPKKLKAEGIRGIIADGEWVAKNIGDFKARDAALIGAAQYAEHYEMAGYQSAVDWAALLGFTDIADILGETLEEEQAASDKLSGLAAGGIDEMANRDDTEEMDDGEMMG
jgi:ferritin-like metal-binding protein YciE